MKIFENKRETGKIIKKRWQRRKKGEKNVKMMVKIMTRKPSIKKKRY